MNALHQSCWSNPLRAFLNTVPLFVTLLQDASVQKRLCQRAIVPVTVSKGVLEQSNFAMWASMEGYVFRFVKNFFNNEIYSSEITDWPLLDQAADDTQSIMDGALCLLNHKLVGAAHHNAHRLPRARAACDLQKVASEAQSCFSSFFPQLQVKHSVSFNSKKINWVSLSKDSTVPWLVCRTHPDWLPLLALQCQASLEWSGRCGRWAWCQ